MGFGSYKTAWHMCHRVRAGLANEDFRKLMGIVEVDETWIGGNDSNRHGKNKKGRFASMTRWVSGGRVHGNSKRGLFLDRLDPPPDEVSEIRVTEPDIHVRLFGRFCEQDTLVLTNFHTRQFLGKRGSQNWAQAMNDCVSHWNRLAIPLLVKTHIGEYVSENYDVFPI